MQELLNFDLIKSFEIGIKVLKAWKNGVECILVLLFKWITKRNWAKNELHFQM